MRKECKQCLGEMNKRNKSFCSKNCYYINKRENEYSGLFLKGHVPVSPFKKGQPAWNKGKKFVHKGSYKKGHPNFVSKEARKRQAEKMKGANNIFWKGGITTPERLRWLGAEYRARKLKSEGAHSQKEWEELKARWGWMCLCCKRVEPEIKLTADHIVPLTKGGSDYIGNIQPLCQKCNSKKMTKTINYAYEN